MRLDDANWEELSEVLKRPGDTLAIIAPNFESRSMLFAQRLLGRVDLGAA